MASDTLKQTSKGLKKTKDQTQFVINRTTRNFPLVERLRDSFGVTHPYKMEFLTYEANDIVNVTFIFAEVFEHTC